MVNGILNAFAYIAKWLREMSLAGGAQNVFAICMFCLIGCVPLVGFIVLCIRNRKIDADYLLLGLSVALFIGIYMMINPGYVIDRNALVTSDMLDLAISSVIWSVMACYAVLRIVENIDRADSVQIVGIIKKIICVIVVFTAFVIVCVSLPELIRTYRADASAMTSDAGWSIILFIFQLVNAALVIWVLIRGYRLCNSIIENEYSDETIRMAERLSKTSKRVISAMVILELSKNVLQLFIMTTLSNADFKISLPLYELIILVVVYMGVRNLAKTKAIKEENDSYI